MSRSGATTSHSRRDFIRWGAVGLPVVIAGCQAFNADAGRRSLESFEVVYDGVGHRCLFDTTGSPSGGNVLAIILLHGAAETGSQWERIGLEDVVDNLDIGSQALVAVAPDLGRPTFAKSFVTDALIPAIDERFAPSHYAISGISRGGAMALDLALRHPSLFRSVGLHSPASNLRRTVDPIPWRCWLDIGREDYLLDGALNTARSLSDSGVDVVEHIWTGDHEDAYWKRHLASYLAFHLDT